MYICTTTTRCCMCHCVLVLLVLASRNACGISETYNASTIVDATTDANNFERIVLEKLQQEATEKQQQQQEKEQEQHINDMLSETRPSTEVLSRKRRYLIFPEGSSFQVVYDLIVGVVDYTNYLILGITVALAWELPSETPSAVLESLQDRLKDGSLGTTRRNDTVNNITYVDTRRGQNAKPQYINFWHQQPSSKKKTYNYYYTNRRVQPAFQIPMHRQYQSYYYRSPGQAQNAASWKRKYWTGNQPHYYSQHAYYSPKKHPFWKWTRPHTSYAYTPGQHSSAAKYPWWNLASRLSNPSRVRRPLTAPVHITVNSPARRLDAANNQNSQRQSKLQHPQRQRNRAGYEQSSAATARKHRIYPIFGKRSIERMPPGGDDGMSVGMGVGGGHSHKRAKRHGIDGPELTELDRIHIRYQRDSRQTLFDKIEKFLDRRGYNGHHCVLRALCETNKKRYHDKRPGSFVGELMRAVFTMPEPLEKDIQEQRVRYMQQRYDSASAFEGDCETQYQHCKDSLWQADFVA